VRRNLRAAAASASRHCVDSEGWRIFDQHLCVNQDFTPHVLEEDMELILIIVVLFVLFGGGGYWGYSRWR